MGDLDTSQLVQDVVQKQATVGDLIDDYMKGLGISKIAEKWGVAVKKVAEVISRANDEGKFIPPDVEVPIDKVTPTPDRQPKPGTGETFLKEGEAPKPAMATTQNQKA